MRVKDGVQDFRGGVAGFALFVVLRLAPLSRLHLGLALLQRPFGLRMFEHPSTYAPHLCATTAAKIDGGTKLPERPVAMALRKSPSSSIAARSGAIWGFQAGL